IPTKSLAAGIRTAGCPLGRPQAPAAAPSQNVSHLNPQVSLRPSSRPAAPPTAPTRRTVSECLPSQSRGVSPTQFAPGRSLNLQTSARILAEIPAASFKNKGLAGSDRQDPGGSGC